MNLYQPFLERALSVCRPGGRVGIVLPWGAAVDEGAERLRERLLDQSAVDTIVGLDNAAGLFPIHRGLRFLVVVASPGRATQEFRARFGVTTTTELDDLPTGDESTDPAASAYPLRLERTQLEVFGGRVPDLRRPHDLPLLDALMRRFLPIGNERGWCLRFGRELNATEDRPGFGASGLPILEGKHVMPFVADASAATKRIEPAEACRRLRGEPHCRARLAYRYVSGVRNRLSLIAAVVPGGVVTTHTLFCLRTRVPLEAQHFLCGLLNSWVLNFVVRLLMGGHLTTSLVETLPAPAWSVDASTRGVACMARRLSRRRSRAVEARLQAAVAHLYGLSGDDFRHVVNGFPLVPFEVRRRALHEFDRLAGANGAA